MGWRVAVLACGGWLLLAGTGCEDTWGKGGRIDRAVQKDLSERSLREAVEEEDEPECPEGKVAHLKCESGPCEWECR